MIIIAPTTDAKSVVIEGITQHTILPITFYAIGLIGSATPAETITLQYWDGVAWRNANMAGKNGVILDVDNAIRALYANLSTFSKANDYYKSNMRLVKTATATEVGAGMSLRGA
jgi:fructose-specific component phosphotransferase system IIB-like protein